MLKIALAKFLTLKAAAVVAATAAGGVVLAASTGVLPTPLTEQPQPVNHSQGPGGDGHSPASPSPSLLGLCQAYSAGANKEKVLANPAFSALVNAAGGVDKVEEFCAALPQPGHKPTSLPSASHPGPTSHPGGPPTSIPSHPRS